MVRRPRPASEGFTLIEILVVIVVIAVLASMVAPSGRTGIYELFVMNDAIRRELPQRSGAGELRALAVHSGMRTLRDDGVRLVREGVTTPEEVLRVTRA